LASFEDLDEVLEEEPILIHSAQAGNRQAFAVLAERYWDRLYRWLYHLTHNRHAAEDLAQETFLKALAGLAGFRPGGNFHAWLFRIAYNNFVNHWRSPGRARQVFLQNLPAQTEGPLDQVLSREALALVARAVGRLPAEYRAAFLLRAEEGLCFQEIGQVLGIKEETARWRVFKARQKLMAVLSPQLNPQET
jgi:RNA polymerase sigma-70 factor, ECF subfamily